MALKLLHAVTRRTVVVTKPSTPLREYRSIRVCEDAKTTFDADFVLREEVGAGAYGHVLLCQRVCDGQLFAVKILDKVRFLAKSKSCEVRKHVVRTLRNEIAVHRLASAHPNVATLYDVYEDDNYLFHVMEYCSGGELYQHVVAEGPLDEANAAFVTKQLCTALKFLHEKCGIVHCDLKPANILLASKDSLQIRLVDFGMSRVLQSGELLSKACGSPFYTAPEAIKTDARIQGYAHSCDMWSLGAVLFVMIFSYPPFVCDEAKYGHNAQKIRQAVYDKVIGGFQPHVYSTADYGYGPWFPDSLPSSASVRNLISHLLQTDATKRLTAAQALNHPWIRGVADGYLVAVAPTVLSRTIVAEDMMYLDVGSVRVCGMLSPAMATGTLPAMACGTPSPCASKMMTFAPSEICTREDMDNLERVKQLILAMAKMTRGCLFREAVAKLYEDEFKKCRADSYATLRCCFHLMDSKKQGVVDLSSFARFVADFSHGRIEAKDVAAMYRELALPGIGELATGGVKEGIGFDDLLTAAVIDYIGRSKRRLERIFCELHPLGTGCVSVEGIVDRLKAADSRSTARWERVAQIISEERVDVRRPHGGGMGFAEFLSCLDPRFQETPLWVDFFSG